MDTVLFVNLPVADVKRSMNFFSQLGFSFNPQYTDHNAACLIIGEKSYVMLIEKTYFKSFTNKQLADTLTCTESILAFSTESRARVDELVNLAIKAGGTTYKNPDDNDHMYGWGFQDPDGHLWEVFYMSQ